MIREIREYEKFISREIRKGNRSVELFRLHQEKILEFQHERLVHLLVMLFFVFFTIIFLGLTLALSAFLAIKGNEILFGLLFGVDLIMTGLSVGYVRHYYLLENGIQRLYKYSEKF